MEKEFIYNEYANFKETFKNQLISINDNSVLLYTHFELAINILDYVYDQKVDNPNFDGELHELFVICFGFVVEKMETYVDLLQKVFKDQEDELFDKQELVSAYLYLIELKNDLTSAKTTDEDILEEINIKTNDFIDRMKNKDFKFNSNDFYENYDKLQAFISQTQDGYVCYRQVIIDAASILKVF